MPPRKRDLASSASASAADEPAPKRRSARNAAKTETTYKDSSEEPEVKPRLLKKKATTKKNDRKAATNEEATALVKTSSTTTKSASKTKKPSSADKPAKDASKSETNGVAGSRAVSEDPDPDSIPTINSDAPRHDGEWYWLMKAEPETRIENGHDVRFSIDDLRSKEKPEGWDGIRNYAARNHMRNMNAGDKAFFYHSNCKEPGIVGIMEIVKEYSEDKSARRPGTPYYDPSATKDKPKWDLVHVLFRKKFAVQIGLKELRDLGKPGGPLENMQMLKQSRLSVSRVSAEEFKALCDIADEKAKEAGLAHEV